MLPISAYSAYDPGFDEEAFKQKLADLWLRMQAAWTAKNIEPLRADLSAPYFAQAQRQLDAHIAAHVRVVFEREPLVGDYFTAFATPFHTSLLQRSTVD